MKTKIPILIATLLFLATVSKAQYGGDYGDNRVSVHGQIVIPGTVAIGYGYNNAGYERYDDRRDRRYDAHRDWRYDDRRDWRAEQYERYCHENRGYRINREEFYRDHCDNRAYPYYAPRKVVEYGRY